MEILEMLQDEDNSSMRLINDAGFYFSPNVDPEHILKLQNFQARSDDVLLVTYPKSGTHWLWEIVSMLIDRSPVLLPQPLLHMEYVSMELLDSIPSQRVLSSHLAFPRLPLDFLRKGSKVVVCVRNPRDVAVSYFEFVSKLTIWDFNGNWDQFFPLFLDGKVAYNSWFDHVDAWLKMANRINQSVHVVFYEDLKKKFAKEVARLAEFLEVDFSPELIENIRVATSFENMKHNKADITIPITKNGGTAIYRKGEVGDWKNYFSDGQIRELDEMMSKWGLDQDPGFQYCSRSGFPNETERNKYDSE